MKKTILSLTLFLALGFMTSRVSAQVDVGISVHVAPPAIPVYEQPPCPVDGWLWIPGYWAWDDDEGYYWVPGYWTAPPEVGFLWTPGYWGWAGGAYAWHAGYWGPHVGFYGGVNYGCGYTGVGYVGGGWAGGHFRYNTAVTRVNTAVVHNTYINRTVVVNNHTRTSFNGGPHGIQARPTASQEVAMRDHHFAPTSMQTQHQQSAHQDRSAFAKVNHGRPATAAVARPFNGRPTTNGGHVGGAPVNRPTINRPQPHTAPAQREASGQRFAPASHSTPAPHPIGHPGGNPGGGHPAPAPRPMGHPGGNPGGGHPGGGHPAPAPRPMGHPGGNPGGGHPGGGHPAPAPRPMGHPGGNPGGGHPGGGHPGGGHPGGGEHHR